MRGALHNLLVDAYCLQHPEDYCRSAKSYAAHLVGLCCGVETAGGARLYRTIARWLDGSRELGRPAEPPPGARGAVTVARVANQTDDAAFSEGARAWAEVVWAAYDTQHALAREWLRAAAAAACA